MRLDLHIRSTPAELAANNNASIDRAVSLLATTASVSKQSIKVDRIVAQGDHSSTLTLTVDTDSAHAALDAQHALTAAGQPSHHRVQAIFTAAADVAALGVDGLGFQTTSKPLLCQSGALLHLH